MNILINKFFYFIFLVYSYFFINIIIYSSSSNAHDCISFMQASTILDGFPNKPITEIDSKLTLEEAYCAQEKLNYLIKKKFNDKIGYKVGFTGEALQKRFKINTPAVGTLYKHMFLSNNLIKKQSDPRPANCSTTVSCSTTANCSATAKRKARPLNEKQDR